MADEPIFGNDDLVQSLRNSLHNREHSIRAFPGLLLRTIETEAWRSFKTPLGELVVNETFHQFLMKEPFNGLGISDSYARQIVQDNKPALDALDQALQVASGAPVGNQNAANDKTTLYNIQDCKAPSGTSESAALRRLRKDRPDLHAKVLDGELSAHAAAVQAGFRPTTFTVRADNPTSIANTLRRRLNRDVLAAVLAELNQPPIEH